MQLASVMFLLMVKTQIKRKAANAAAVKVFHGKEGSERVSLYI